MQWSTSYIIHKKSGKFSFQVKFGGPNFKQVHNPGFQISAKSNSE